jgi:hypothetical protein
MKRLKFKYDKTKNEHKYKEELVISPKNTFEKLCAAVDDQTQAPASDHGNQDSFLDSETQLRTQLCN